MCCDSIHQNLANFRSLKLCCVSNGRWELLLKVWEWCAPIVGRTLPFYQLHMKGGISYLGAWINLPESPASLSQPRMHHSQTLKYTQPQLRSSHFAYSYFCHMNCNSYSGVHFFLRNDLFLNEPALLSYYISIIWTGLLAKVKILSEHLVV